MNIIFVFLQKLVHSSSIYKTGTGAQTTLTRWCSIYSPHATLISAKFTWTQTTGSWYYSQILSNIVGHVIYAQSLPVMPFHANVFCFIKKNPNKVLISVAQGRIDTARHLISFHPAKNTSAFKAVDEQMRTMPNFSVTPNLRNSIEFYF